MFYKIKLGLDDVCCHYTAAATDDGVSLELRAEQKIERRNPVGEVCAREKRGLVFKHSIADEDDFFFGQAHPNGAAGGSRVMFEQHRRLSPVQGHLSEE